MEVEMRHNNQSIKVFRAEKTTKNQDDFKVLVVGLMISIIILLMIPFVGTTYDKQFAERPFLTATVEIVKTDDYELPMLLYDADAKQHVQATWIATIRDAKDIRLETRRGNGDYIVREDSPRLWTWEAFFDNESGGASPRVPEQPFMVCLRYTSRTVDTNTVDETPEVCSKVFYPSEGTPIVEEVQ